MKLGECFSGPRTTKEKAQVDRKKRYKVDLYK